MPADAPPLAEPRQADRERVMRPIRFLLLLLLGLVAIAFGGGMLLSPRFTVMRSVEIQASSEAIYPLLADPRSWAALVGLEPA